jgi:hypothetical protein
MALTDGEDEADLIEDSGHTFLNDSSEDEEDRKRVAAEAQPSRWHASFEDMPSISSQFQRYLFPQLATL